MFERVHSCLAFPHKADAISSSRKWQIQQWLTLQRYAFKLNITNNTLFVTKTYMQRLKSCIVPLKLKQSAASWVDHSGSGFKIHRNQTKALLKIKIKIYSSWLKLKTRTQEQDDHIFLTLIFFFPRSFLTNQKCQNKLCKPESWNGSWLESSAMCKKIYSTSFPLPIFHPNHADHHCNDQHFPHSSRNPELE